MPLSGEGEHQFDFRSKDKDIPWGIATIYHPPQVRNHDEKSEKDGYKYNKLDKLTTITNNSIKILNLLLL